MASSSGGLPGPQHAGFWSTVFGGSQPYSGSGAQQPAFTFTAPSMPLSVLGPPSGPSNGFPSSIYAQQPVGSAQDRESSSASNPGHSTSPEVSNGKAGSSGEDRAASAGQGDNEERIKKTRKRQQTSCSECHRRKQKCNQVCHQWFRSIRCCNKPQLTPMVLHLTESTM